MTLSFSLQLKGYWLSFFAWLILSFSTLATSFAESDEGFLRLCTSQGAQWVLQDGNSSKSNASSCLCLSAIISTASANFNVPLALSEDIHSFQVIEPIIRAINGYHSRAPPLAA